MALWPDFVRAPQSVDFLALAPRFWDWLSCFISSLSYMPIAHLTASGIWADPELASLPYGSDGLLASLTGP